MTRGPIATFVFFAVLMALVAAVHVFVYRRVSTHLGLGKRTRRVLGALLVASPVVLVASRKISDYIEPERAGPFVFAYAIAFTIVIVVLITAALLLPVEVGVRIAHLVSRERARRDEADRVERNDDHGARPEGEAGEASSEALTRREILLRGTVSAATSVATFSALHGALVGRHDYAIEEHVVRLPKLSPRLEGYTIVQLSDVHVGPFVQERELAAAVDLVKRARPDHIVITGDMIDHDPRYVSMLQAFVARLTPLARDGVTTIAGNHDYYTGIEDVVRAVESGGARFLRNRGIVVGDPQAGFALLGVDDVWAEKAGGPGPRLGRALRDVPQDLPRILLAHQPIAFEQSHDRVDLQLSGHTHGGQVSIGVNPAYAVLPNGWIRGFYTLGESRLYVNRGFGTAGPPIRIGSAPEITRFVLVAG